MKMKKIKTITYIVCLLAGMTTVSCSDFLDEYSQDQYYAHEWEDLDELLIGSAYIFYSNPQEPPYWTGSDTGTGHEGAFLHFLTDDVDENTTGVSQEFDCQDGYYKRYQHTYDQNDQLCGAEGKTEFHKFQKTCAEHNRDCQEKGKFCRNGTGCSRNHGKYLKAADDQRCL